MAIQLAKMRRDEQLENDLTKMDQRETRESLGTNHHFKPKMNPDTAAANATKQNWWSTSGKTQPLQMRIRQNSVSSDTSSPVGSPTSATEMDFSKFERRNSKTLYTSFGFTN